MVNTKTQQEINTELAAAKATLANEGRELVAAGEVPFDIAIADNDLVPFTIEACASREQDDVRLAFLLHRIYSKELHLEEGYTKFSDYVEERIRFTGTKARAMVRSWESFLSVGLPIEVFGGTRPVSWSKFK